MTPLAELLPGPTDRAAFIGQTGSGKTTLARYMLRVHPNPYHVVFDPKGQMDVGKDWPAYTLYSHLDDVARAKEPRVIYRPTYHELTDPEVMDEFFEWVYLRRNTVLYVDEIYAVAKGDTFPEYYGACLTRGRELDICVYTSTQRPARVPQIMFSESEHVYCFFLKMPRDRERVEDMTGIPREDLRLPEHEFYYAPQRGAVRGPLRLALPKAGRSPSEAAA